MDFKKNCARILYNSPTTDFKNDNVSCSKDNTASQPSLPSIKMMDLMTLDLRLNTQIKGHFLTFEDLKYVLRRGQPPRGGAGEPRGLWPQREQKQYRGRQKDTEPHSKQRGFRSYSSHLRRAERRRVKRAASRNERRRENAIPPPSRSRAMAPRGYPDCRRICMSLNYFVNHIYLN